MGRDPFGSAQGKLFDCAWRPLRGRHASLKMTEFPRRLKRRVVFSFIAALEALRHPKALCLLGRWFHGERLHGSFGPQRARSSG